MQTPSPAAPSSHSVSVDNPKPSGKRRRKNAKKATLSPSQENTVVPAGHSAVAEETPDSQAAGNAGEGASFQELHSEPTDARSFETSRPHGESTAKARMQGDWDVLGFDPGRPLRAARRALDSLQAARLRRDAQVATSTRGRDDTASASAQGTVRDAVAARAWAVYTLGGGILQAITTRVGMRVQAGAEDTETSRLANAKAAEKLGDALRSYHDYRVEGLQNIPTTGPVLVVAHHSLATYDIGLLSAAIRRAQGRTPMTLVDRLIFKIPPLGAFLGSIGCVEAAPDEATRLLRDNNVVIVAPGGMREALRPSSDKYSISWANRYGFARLAIDTRVPVVCAACPRADDLYDVYPNALTQFFFKRFHLPVPVLRGIGLTLLPRAQKLVHYITEPLQPPVAENADDLVHKARVFQEQVAQRMEALLQAHR